MAALLTTGSRRMRPFNPFAGTPSAPHVPKAPTQGLSKRDVLCLGSTAIGTSLLSGGVASALDRRPSSASASCKVAPVRGWVTANNCSLRYEVSGSGSHAVVLLHEIGMALESWDMVLASLPLSHRYVRYDLRGFGLSQKLERPVTFEDEVADLEALLDALDLTSDVTLVGSSLGGAIALAFAAAHPKRVARIIALSPATGVSEDRRASMLATADKVEAASMSSFVKQMVDSSYPASIRTADGLARFQAMQIASDPRSCAAMVRMIANTPFLPILQKVSAPTLVVAAALDKGRSVESMREVVSNLAHGRFKLLNSGHFMPVQAPKEVASIISSCLMGSLGARTTVEMLG